MENEVSFLGAGERYRESDEYKRRQPTSADSPGLHEGFTGQAELPKDARAIAQRQIRRSLQSFPLSHTETTRRHEGDDSRPF